MAELPESTCRHCLLTVLWIASENRWCSSTNDHSWCPDAPNHRHDADMPMPLWPYEPDYAMPWRPRDGR